MHDKPIARPGQYLSAHLVNVAQLAGVFARAIGFPLAGQLVGGGHDEGKVSQTFQHYIRSAAGITDPEDEEYVDAKGFRGKIDHSSAGAQRLWQAIMQERAPAQNVLFAQMLALCICSHHSGLIDCLGPWGEDLFKRRMEKPSEQTHIEEALEAFGDGFGASGEQLLPATMKEMRDRLAAMLRPEPSAYCDKCSLRPTKACRIHNPLAWFSLGLATRMLFSCLVDADHTDSADAEHPENAALRSHGTPPWRRLVERLEKRFMEFSGNRAIDAIRSEISAHCLARATGSKGVFTLTVPTGGGKTLAGLRFALHHAVHHSMSRIINVIPFTSIIDQNAQVAREILECGEEFGRVVLEHHSNLTPEKESPRTRLASECWDAPVIYTTMVQFLESLFRGGTRNARRMHRLAGAIIVFDEIQTLPVNCAHLFCNAVNFLVRECGASVVLCTATQPLLDRLARPELGVLSLDPRCELMPHRDAYFDKLERTEILDDTKPGGWSVTEIADLAIGELRRAGSCLVVVNTKRWARELYEECAARGIAEVRHLSTDMCAAHRLCVLDEMRAELKAGRPVLCVSTQLIEAGVDVSFGAAIRFVAGLDSIVQTAGRCNRNGESKDGRPGQVHVVNPDRENLSRLREIQTGREMTLRVLGDFRKEPDSLGGSLLHPKAMERYFTYAFFDRRDEMAYPVSAEDAGHGDTLFNLLSCNPLNPGNMHAPLALRQSFATAGEIFTVIDAPTCGVLVPYGEGKDLIAQLCGVFHPQQEKPLLRRAQRYSVNVFPNVLKGLQGAQALHETQKGSGVWYLDAQHYSGRFGLSVNEVEEMAVHIC
ncbi:CRISPR-associated endonuclease Cas3'' [Desulfovibrio aminophilus]|uniref:CRISPR-associated endonuclease Cas3'' n=1 Tax=Desulfovibrio aminophilus TaxID=81425 RepID=UPI0006876BA9|nr:CRISPR-associated endonuclease Cas3'' [Desulfovibrio aminophilus]